MFFYLENNWTQWGYQQHNSLFRQSPDDTFRMQFLSCSDPLGSLRQEAVHACESIRDVYAEPLCVLFSGGAESEIMLRAFCEARIPVSIYIARYENDYNIYDVSHAVVICESLQLPYTIIDFNLTDFFENRAESYAVLSQIFEPRMLPHLAFAEQVDGIPLLAGGEVALRRTNSNYTRPGTWVIDEKEYNWGWVKYFLAINRPAVPDWCRWTSNLYLAWMQLDWFKQLINDEYYGKLGINSTKIQGYREQWPELMPRIKAHGFERIGDLAIELEQYLDKKYNRAAHEARVSYTVDEFYQLIRGHAHES